MLHKCSLLSFRVKVNNVKKKKIPLSIEKDLRSGHCTMGLVWVTLSEGLVHLPRFPQDFAKEDRKGRRLRGRLNSCTCSLFLHLWV